MASTIAPSFALLFVTSLFAGDDTLVDKMAKHTGVGYGTQRPGGIHVTYDDDMTAVKAIGKDVWVHLLKKIGQLDDTDDVMKADKKELASVQEGEVEKPTVMTARKVFLMKVSVIAADLEIKELVPVLFAYVEDKDDAFSDILAVHIAAILKLPDACGYHRHWFDQATRAKFREAVAEKLKSKE